MAMRRAFAVVLLFAAVPAYANNPPAPPVFFGIVGLPLLILLLFGFAGGYAIRKEQTGAKTRLRGSIIAVFILVLVAAVSEGYAFFVLVGMAIWAIVRSVQLLLWSFDARRADPRPHVEGSSPSRLAICGSLLLVAAILIGGFAFAFTATFPPPYPQTRVDALRSWVALQLAGADVPPEVAQKRNSLEEELIGRMNSYRSENRVAIERRNGGFTIFMLPGERRFPFYPYSLMFSAPSYRADQTGAIRMAYVRHRDERCPPDAPVVYQISQDDLLSIRRGDVLPRFP